MFTVHHIYNLYFVNNIFFAVYCTVHTVLKLVLVIPCGKSLHETDGWSLVNVETLLHRLAVTGWSFRWPNNILSIETQIQDFCDKRTDRSYKAGLPDSLTTPIQGTTTCRAAQCSEVQCVTVTQWQQYALRCSPQCLRCSAVQSTRRCSVRWHPQCRLEGRRCSKGFSCGTCEKDVQRKQSLRRLVKTRN